YKCDKAYESLEKLILDPKIDAVAVFSGAPDHARHMIDCMKHGKHVVSAVPACLTLEEAASMKQIKEKTGLKYMMAETSYFRAPTIFARKVWAEGVFGNFLFSEVEYYHTAKTKKYMANLEKKKNDGLYWRDGKKTWRYGLPPMLYPTHSTGFHVGVTGERMTQVSCHGWGPDFAMYKPGANAYDNPFRNSVALFKTDAGNVSRCNVCWQINASGERAQWLGETAALYMKGSGGQPFAYQHQGKQTMNTQPSYLHLLPEPMRVSCGHGNSHTFLTHEFISALVEDREPAVDIYEALAMTTSGIVANESAKRNGEQLKIPCFDKV
ncbi:MAG: Gfo/Idh/MocA family oxidoreductase, partial [Pirellulales bacterium]|nr:Gfo/Idh/MocA family oxidoreductase [Pirellulales bacterium]